jgi:hypothetical protein
MFYIADSKDVKRKMKREKHADKTDATKKRRSRKAEGGKSRSTLRGVQQQSKIIHKVVPKAQAAKNKRKKIEFYDDVDREALKLMKTLRVTWLT